MFTPGESGTEWAAHRSKRSRQCSRSMAVSDSSMRSEDMMPSTRMSMSNSSRSSFTAHAAGFFFNTCPYREIEEDYLVGAPLRLQGLQGHKLPQNLQK